MYLPTAFVEHQPETLLAFMRAHPFATLITADSTGTHAGHLPFIISQSSDGQVELLGHLARANPQSLHHGPALVIFHGPHAYVSADWYNADNVVPTWNYQVVHVTGELSATSDADTIDGLLAEIGKSFEPRWPAPWHQRITPDVRQSMIQQITAVKIKVTNLTGKWKLSQNHPIERRKLVAAELRRLGGDDRVAVAAAMEETIPPNAGQRT